MKHFRRAITWKYLLILAPMKHFRRAITWKYLLILAPMKHLRRAIVEKYPLIPAAEKQFIFLAAIACALQYPNKHSFISQKNKIFYVFSELLLTFHPIYVIVYIITKKYSGRRIYLPPQLLSNVTDAFALQGLMRLFLFWQACIACSQPKGVQISDILPDYNGNLLVHSLLPCQDGGVLAPPFCFSCKSFSLAARSSKRAVRLPADEKICNRTPCCCPEPSPIRFRVSTWSESIFRRKQWISKPSAGCNPCWMQTRLSLWHWHGHCPSCLFATIHLKTWFAATIRRSLTPPRDKSFPIWSVKLPRAETLFTVSSSIWIHRASLRRLRWNRIWSSSVSRWI